jgi:hypothetical protein
VDGGLYPFSSETAISGSPSDGETYIKFVISGTDAIPTFTNTSPTWNDAKQGWYDGTDRYLFRLWKNSSSYYDKEKLKEEQYATWPSFLKPYPIAREAEDLTLSGGTKTQRVIYCKNLHITANSTLQCRTLWVEGDFTIDNGVTLTIDALQRNARGSDVEYKLGGDNPGQGGNNTEPKPGSGFRAGQASKYSNIGGGGGGFGTGGKGEASDNTDIAGGASNGIDIADGGDAAYSGGRNAAGGGATCGGGGSHNAAGDSGGDAGELIFVIVGGNFSNQGTINNNGGDATAGSEGGGGGGGGITVIFCYGELFTGGTINCEGGDAAGTAYSGGGAGGAIVIYARASSFGTLSVAGGSGVSIGNDGNDGMTETVDIGSHPYSVIGGKDSDPDCLGGKLLHWIEGVPI